MRKQVRNILRSALIVAAATAITVKSVAQTANDYNKRELLWQVLDLSLIHI